VEVNPPSLCQMNFKKIPESARLTFLTLQTTTRLCVLTDYLFLLDWRGNGRIPDFHFSLKRQEPTPKEKVLYQ